MQERHARQARLPEVGAAGQARLRGARILVVGLGGLGCPAADLLVRAGVGTLGLCDFDRVDATNLHRQSLYSAADVGRPKVEAAVSRLKAIDASVSLLLHALRLDASNASALVKGYDVVVDGLDELDARYVLSDACRGAGIPVVHGAVSRWEGQVTVFDPPRAPCYRCLHPVPPGDALTCAEEGVMGPVPALVGSVQAHEALKLVLRAGAPLRGRLWLWDGLLGEARTITLMRRPECACTVDEAPACPLPWAAPRVAEIGVADFSRDRSKYYLLDVREEDEHEAVALAGSHLIPLGELPKRTSELPRDRPIVCYCAVGGRSARAAKMLGDAGFDARNLRGGMRAWLMEHPDGAL